MQDLKTILGDEQITALRAGYDPHAMRAAMLKTIIEPYPALGPWNEGIAASFYADQSPLRAIDRERCLLAVLSISAVPVSLAIHIYWGLMEGITVEETCHILGLAACYAGVPALSRSLPTLHDTLHALARISATQQRQSLDVVKALVTELAGMRSA
jgi:alkylhydroperoxidase/carboxymuconolactone decarboxylase family protein YurZ